MGMCKSALRAGFFIQACLLTLASPAASPTETIGILPNIVIATNVATANSLTTQPGRPAVGCDGTNYLVVTSRTSGNPIGLIGVIVSGKGAVLHEFGIGGQAGTAPYPAVAFGGTNYLLVFNRQAQIYGLRISCAGQLLDSSDGFLISSGSPSPINNYRPNVAFDGQNFLVVWQRYQDPDYDIFGARVTTGGQVLNEFPIFRAPRWQIVPQVAFGGANFLVVWEHEYGTWPNVGVDVYGARVSPAGTSLDPAGIQICSATNDQVSPHLAFDGQNYLVAWLDQRNRDPDSYSWDVFATRVAPNGTVLDGSSSAGGIAINTLSEEKNDPRVCFDGKDFFVTWWLSTYDPPAGSFAVRVSSGGVLLDGPPESPGLQIRPPDCWACKVVHPNPVSNGRSIFVPWINNAELGGTYKTVFANLIVPQPQITDLVLGSPSEWDAKVAFASRLDVPYLMQWSSDLTTWQTSGGPIKGTGQPMEVVLPNAVGDGQRFFRLQVDY
jgi:hypothetical protein